MKKFALVDGFDYQKLSKYPWYLSSYGYAVTVKNFKVGQTWRSRVTQMHRIIMDAKSGQIVDHINGNPLDNRRSNLRFATKSQNACNRIHLGQRNKSGSNGVFWSNNARKWTCQIKINGRTKHLGYYSKISDAIRVRKQVEERYFGEFSPIKPAS